MEHQKIGATSYPIITACILATAGIEKLSTLIAIGTLITVLGLVIVTSNDQKTQRIQIKAILLGIGVSFGWGTSIVMAKLILDNNEIALLALMTVRTLLIGTTAFLAFLFSPELKLKFKKQSFPARKKAIYIFG